MKWGEKMDSNEIIGLVNFIKRSWDAHNQSVLNKPKKIWQTQEWRIKLNFDEVSHIFLREALINLNINYHYYTRKIIGEDVEICTRCEISYIDNSSGLKTISITPEKVWEDL